MDQDTRSAADLHMGENRKISRVGVANCVRDQGSCIFGSPETMRKAKRPRLRRSTEADLSDPGAALSELALVSSHIG